MISGNQLQNRLTAPAELTARQSQAATLVRTYYAVAHELPSTSWLARRLNISRQRAQVLMARLRDKRVDPLAD